MKLLRIIIIAIILLIIAFFNIILKNRNDKKINKNIVKQPYFYFRYSLSASIILFLCGIYGLTIQKSLVDGLGVIGMAILIIPVTMFFHNWKIEFNSCGFSVTNLVNKTKEYKYENIEIKEVNSGFKIYYKTKKKKIVEVPFMLENASDFLSAYEEWKNNN